MPADYHPMPATTTCTEAWLAAAEYLRDHGSVNSMILHVEDPISRTEIDDAIIAEVDALLRKHGAYPISTVANTIFPQSLYRPGNPERLYKLYGASLPKMKAITRDWGRYFDRMIRWPRADKNEQNQLDQLIKNLKAHGPDGDRSTYYNIYEITLFHPEKDAQKVANRQCLSFIEIKPEKRENGKTVLHMTALYRSHYYASRTLGNLIGLSRLLSFIARESGYEAGALTIHSTHAELDTGVSNPSKGRSAWGKRKLEQLIKRCAEIRDGSYSSSECDARLNQVA